MVLLTKDITSEIYLINSFSLLTLLLSFARIFSNFLTQLFLVLKPSCHRKNTLHQTKHQIWKEYKLPALVHSFKIHQRIQFEWRSSILTLFSPLYSCFHWYLQLIIRFSFLLECKKGQLAFKYLDRIQCFRIVIGQPLQELQILFLKNQISQLLFWISKVLLFDLCWYFLGIGLTYGHWFLKGDHFDSFERFLLLKAHLSQLIWRNLE